SKSSVRVTFQAAGLKVLDPKESAEDRAKVQKNMETEVLAVAQYPRIAFESTAIEALGGDKFRVRGNLTLHGKSQSVVIPVTMTKLADGTYEVRGEYKLKQTEFGIQPI